MSLHLSKCHIVGNHMSRFKFLCREREEEDAFEQARQAHMAKEQSDVDKQKAKREKERLKEQEKRKRLAVS